MATVSMSMATKSSNLDDQKSGVNVQTESHTFTPPSGQNGPEVTEMFGSAPFPSPSQSLARKPTPDHHETQYCLEIQVISTKEGELHHHPHMPGRHQLWKTWAEIAKSGLTEAVVTGPSMAILFYGWQLLGEGLSFSKA